MIKLDKNIKVVVSGCCGRMGRIVVEELKNESDMVITSGLGTSCSKVDNVDVYDSKSFNSPHDVIIDFSNPSALDSIFEISEKFGSNLVLCTTGYSKNQIEQIKEFSKNRAVFMSSNTSLGIHVILETSKLAKKMLGDSFDIEIIEKHHNKKIDAPSGTALMISDALSDKDTKIIFDRTKERRERSKNEIGIHSIRGGGLTGEHEVLFIGQNELISVNHVSYSRRIFAQGAIRAARFIVDKQNGMYVMRDLFTDQRS